jgi:hypothetical protein
VSAALGLACEPQGFTGRPLRPSGRHARPGRARRLRASVAQAAVDREIELARINRKADVEIAKIQAGAATAISETEAEADVARAEGIAEGMETVIDAGAPAEPADAAEPEGDPAEIVVVDSSERDGEAEPAIEPPPAEEPEAPAVARRKGWF